MGLIETIDARRSRSGAGSDHVVILLGLFNGAATLAEQLESLVAQTHGNWSLLVSDDGSIDEGLEILADFARGWPVRVTMGPRRGFALNYLHLLNSVDDDSPFVAFCDQDDVWLPEKIARAVAALREVPETEPAMYCGRTLHCRADLSVLCPSPRFRRPPSFRNALLQNIGGGNTIVLNNAALRLLRRAGRRIDAIVSHDWWCYQVISGAGGRAIYEPRPGLLYRQHAGNAVGASGTPAGRLSRCLQVLRGRYRRWNTVNIAALTAARHVLTEENRRVLEGFSAARSAPLIRRLLALGRLRLHRQTCLGTAAIWLAAVLGRL